MVEPSAFLGCQMMTWWAQRSPLLQHKSDAYPAGQHTFVGFLISAATKYFGPRESLSDTPHLPADSSVCSLQKGYFQKQGVRGP